MPPVAANLRRVRDCIADAAARAGRPSDDVTLVAVVKYAELDWVRALLDEGVRDLGEARPQQLAERAAMLPGDVTWHLIGSLQRNKAGLTLDAIGDGLIHSVDSARLARRLATLAEDRGCRPRVLLQVNITEEESKQGFTPAALRDRFAELAASPSLRLDGLMTMAAKRTGPTDDGPRRAFDALRQLRDELATPSHPLPSLSMGMSGDFEDAIAAGATHVRIGSTLFEDT